MATEGGGVELHRKNCSTPPTLQRSGPAAPVEKPRRVRQYILPSPEKEPTIPNYLRPTIISSCRNTTRRYDHPSSHPVSHYSPPPPPAAAVKMSKKPINKASRAPKKERLPHYSQRGRGVEEEEEEKPSIIIRRSTDERRKKRSETLLQYCQGEGEGSEISLSSNAAARITKVVPIRKAGSSNEGVNYYGKDDQSSQTYNNNEVIIDQVVVERKNKVKAALVGAYEEAIIDLKGEGEEAEEEEETDEFVREEMAQQAQQQEEEVSQQHMMDDEEEHGQHDELGQQSQQVEVKEKDEEYITVAQESVQHNEELTESTEDGSNNIVGGERLAESTTQVS